MSLFLFFFFSFFSSKSKKGGFLVHACLLFLLRCGVGGHLGGAGWYALLVGGQLQSWSDSMMFEGLVWAWRNIPQACHLPCFPMINLYQSDKVVYSRAGSICCYAFSTGLGFMHLQSLWFL